MKQLSSQDLFDAHCHLSFSPSPQDFTRLVAANLQGAFSTTVSLQDYRFAKEAFASWQTVKVGLGLHPWWVSRGEGLPEDETQIDALVSKERFIGEIGLDFGRNGLAKSVFATEEETRAAQVRALRAILAACARNEVVGVASAQDLAERVFSFHTVRSVDVVLDLLQGYDLISSNTIIFHWFSGSSAQLQRARELGCFFSINAFMLQTKRGREYAKAIPLDRLLVETDLPEDPQGNVSSVQVLVDEGETRGRFEAVYRHYEQTLVSAYEQLIELRGQDAFEALVRNAQNIFG